MPNHTQELRQALEEVQKELAEQKLHEKRALGYAAELRRELICTLTSSVHQFIDHRLDNIRGYADRENPNREVILEIVGEIQRHLSTLGHDIS